MTMVYTPMDQLEIGILSVDSTVSGHCLGVAMTMRKPYMGVQLYAVVIAILAKPA